VTYLLERRPSSRGLQILNQSVSLLIRGKNNIQTPRRKRENEGT